MFAGYPRSRARRRGIVLVLVLAMLGILAVIGVTFATFSGQAQVNARNFALSQVFPDSTEMMDFALSQLVNDTGNPLSALRGHGLLRDMYGNDAATNGYLDRALNPVTGSVTPLLITGYSTSYNSITGQVTYTFQTNIATSTTYGMNFTRWVLRLPPTQAPPQGYVVGETFEVLIDDASSGVHVLTATPPDQGTFTVHPTAGYLVSENLPQTGAGAPVDSISNRPFVLDGRYLHAFNGPGAYTNPADPNNQLLNAVTGNADNFAKYGNFRFNGPLQNLAYNQPHNPNYLGDPNAVGMDEDYDACDLENWWLAIQSADGQVVIPSFHRPGILVQDITTGSRTVTNPVPGLAASPSAIDDWRDYPLGTTIPLFSSLGAAQQQAVLQTWSKILRPRAVDHPNSVSFPDLKPNANTGQIDYDVDNDGDGLTDSVWLDLGYPPRRDATGRIFKPLFAFMVIGLNGRIPLNTAGNLQLRDITVTPLGDHASRLGNSPSEIYPGFALQNAFDPSGSFTQYDTAFGNPTSNTAGNGISVALTQLRNILTGTRPQDNNFALDGQNFDNNYVLVNNQQFFLPNNVADSGDYIDPASGAAWPTGPTSGSPVVRSTLPVAGRWGEGAVVPYNLGTWSSGNPLPFATQVGPGLSYLAYANTPDIIDDDFDTYDPYPTPLTGEAGDYYDAAGALPLPSERYRRFVTPMDLAGDGAVTPYNNALFTPTGSTTPVVVSLGPDLLGRVSFFKYFRPPGMPVAPSVGMTGNPVAATVKITTWNGSAYPATQTIDAPIGSPTATDATTGTSLLVDVTNNRLHNYEGARNPGPLTNPANPLYVAAQPANSNPTTGEVPPFSNPTSVPSYTADINYKLQNQVINRADEMGLYGATPYDAPYGFGDLEWLYRQQDSDGASLYSRLALLAPVSFTNPKDGLRRCRLFCTDTWDTTNFAWAADNPGNVFPNNSRFTTLQSASNYAYEQNLNAALGTSGNTHYFEATPELAQRDRRINLNYPLPVSNDPHEPVRQKWIRESYQLLKNVLPPRAVDTPQELAQLSQFLTNVIDFRDPDGAITVYTNPDVLVAYSTSTPGPIYYLNQATVPGQNTALYPPTGTTTAPLTQFGMEYNPVAINEVLAYTFPRKDVSKSTTTGTQTNRFFIELVNVLTQSQQSANTPDADPSWLDLTNWDLVFSPDDPINRPDPVTGQNPDPTVNSAATVYGPVGLNVPYDPKSSFGASNPGLSRSFLPAPTGGAQQPMTLPPLNANGFQAAVDATLASGTNLTPPTTPPQTYATPAFNPFMVFGNLLPGKLNAPTGQPAFESNPPDPAGSVPDATTGTTVTQSTYPQQVLTFVDYQRTDPAAASGTTTYLPETDFFDYANNGSKNPAGYTPATFTAIPPPALGSGGKYYWVYLRRPANPFLPASATNPMVVVDAMRFPYLETGISVTKVDSSNSASPPPATPAKNDQGNGTPINQDTFGPPGGETGGTQKNAGGGNKIPTPSTNDLYSAQRMQPFRGGHAVPNPNGVGINPVYGYSEQLAKPVTQSGNMPMFGGWPLLNFTGWPLLSSVTATTNPPFGIYHTLGAPNDYEYPNTKVTPTEEWDYFPFHDRDFNSVAELLLVPGCPPGLFTKQFVEFPPGINSTNGEYFPLTGYGVGNAGHAYPPKNVPGSTSGGTDYPAQGSGYSNSFAAPTLTTPRQPHTYPYLIDQFYYTGASGTADAKVPNTVGGPSGAGWHKMFEIFEVPSPAIGAIGTVDQGNNFDWARQDLRPGLLNLNLIIDEEVFMGLVYTSNNYIPVNTTPGRAPQIVTQIDSTGAPNNPANNGFDGTYNYASPGYFEPNNGSNAIKQAFADFLRLRHGGSNYLFGFGTGAVGSTLPMERPFHSLSYPDIDYTLMRPAGLPSAGGDPGVKNAAITYTYPPGGPPTPNMVLPEPIPTRRLFQVPDAYAGGGPYNASNAGVTGDPFVMTLYRDRPLDNDYGNLASGSGVTTSFLGSVATVTGAADRRQTPAFRIEWMQRMMNLTTVRTHQFAVWVTVGFFEVARQGDPQLADISPNLAYDQFGNELNSTSGTVTRYRSFFLIDRTRAAGFNQGLPGNFRDVIVYRQSIE